MRRRVRPSPADPADNHDGSGTRETHPPRSTQEACEAQYAALIYDVDSAHPPGGTAGISLEVATCDEHVRAQASTAVMTATLAFAPRTMATTVRPYGTTPTDGGQRWRRHSSQVAKPTGGASIGSVPSSSPAVGTWIVAAHLARSLSDIDQLV